jgi:spermidine synthase
VKAFELLRQTVLADGDVMKLVRRDDEYIMLVGGAVLMSSRMHGSEEALAALACERVRRLERHNVLIGGLGMGYTVRRTHAVLPAGAPQDPFA